MLRLHLWAGGLGIIMGLACAVQFIMVPDQPFWPDLFDTKATALFDLWVLGHLMFGIILAGCFQRLLRVTDHPPPWQSGWLLWVLTAVVAWEVIELAGELGYCGTWAQNWLAGTEFWFNRYVMDPAVALIGCWVWRCWPRCFWPVTLAGLAFEAVNLMAPNALTIQDWLVGLFT